LIAIFPYIIVFIVDEAGPDDDDSIAVAAINYNTINIFTI
jgi:hypothetical protein